MNLRSLRLWTLGALALCGACERAHERQPNPYSLVAYDPLPADVGAQTCGIYRERLTGSPHEATLDRLFAVRPHKYWQPAEMRDLVELDPSVVSASRADRVIYRPLLHREVADSLVALIRAADADGLHLRVQSAYRSPGYQNLLWKLAVRSYGSDLTHAAFAVAPPCFSEHATGRALDFDPGPGGGSGFEHSPEYLWLADNAARWGWSQSFRRDNGAADSPRQRGIFVEPWHFHHASLESVGRTPGKAD